jgi:signal recognition particle subunit SRP54
VQDVNRLLKQFLQMQDMMKRVKKLGQKGLMRGGIPGLMPPGAMPPGLK